MVKNVQMVPEVWLPDEGHGDIQGEAYRTDKMAKACETGLLGGTIVHSYQLLDATMIFFRPDMVIPCNREAL